MDQVNVANDLTQLIMPLIGVLVSGIIALSIKDYITKMTKGLAFAMNRAFNEGDHVILDKEPAIIVKVGATQTVFGLTKPDGTYTWRYVPNERIPGLRLERVVFDHKPTENQKKIQDNQDKIEANMAKLAALHAEKK
jgi:hypothetical protein|tara:strand:- start:203 stop:613 length:411 start_codon:yes stop_codon:yes gene_type:complete